MNWTTSSFSGGGDCVQVAPALNWTTSTFSGGGNCVEAAVWETGSMTNATCVQATAAVPCTDEGCGTAAVAFVKSSASGGGGSNCVQGAPVEDMIFVRDSKNPQGPVLAFTRAEWGAFVRGVQAGEMVFGVL